MFDFQVHAVLGCAISELLQTFPVVGMSSLEYKIKRGMRSSREAQNSVSFV
jgi:hypothetical protein